MKLKELWKTGQSASGLWCSIGDPAVIELAARAGFDYVTVDLQHGFNTWDSLPATLRILRTCPTTVLVRVQECDPVQITRALDLGADGVVVPLVNDAEIAAQAVAACRYPAAKTGTLGGNRSFGPIWADHDGVANTDQTNQEVVCVVQIETAQALHNLDAILRTPGIDAAYVGPYDLALSCGRGEATYRTSPEMDSDITTVMEAAVAAGVVAGMHCDGPEMAEYWRERGARMLTASLDTAVIRQAYEHLAASVRAT